MQGYQQVLQALYGRSGMGIKLGLVTMHEVTAQLGVPQAAYPCVVVAGTNGKGSTAQLLQKILQAHGKRAGLYTSPHLLRFNERIRVGGDLIDDAQVAALYARLQHAETAIGRTVSFFEAATAMAFLHFEAMQVDVAILEVGLGGRLDATNVVKKALSVITPISYDHQDILGDSLTAIAREKAGIIQRGVAVISAPQHPEVEIVLEQTARALSAPFSLVQDVAPVPGHLPAYQAVNVATACAAARALRVPQHAIDEGVAHFAWPGRYQWVTEHVLLDGAHNVAGMHAFFTSLQVDPRLKGRRRHAVFGVLVTKDAAAMLEALWREVDSLTLCPLPGRRGRDVKDLLKLAPQATAAPSIGAALREAEGRALQDGGVVLALGSLYLVGEVLGLLTKAPRDPPVDG